MESEHFPRMITESEWKFGKYPRKVATFRGLLYNPRKVLPDIKGKSRKKKQFCHNFVPNFFYSLSADYIPESAHFPGYNPLESSHFPRIIIPRKLALSKDDHPRKVNRKSWIFTKISTEFEIILWGYTIGTRSYKFMRKKPCLKISLYSPFKGSVSQKLRPRLLYIIRKLSL